MGRSYITNSDLYPCPCCGYRVHELQGSTASCPICAWEDSEEQLHDPYLGCAPNGVDLWHAQRNFMNSGVSNPKRAGYENMPKATDHRDELWRPIVDGLDDFGTAAERSKRKLKSYNELYYWRASFWNCKAVYCLSLELAPLDLERAHKLSIFNRKQILSSELCGCFYCCKMFKPEHVEKWIDRDLTGLCPFCGIDSVIGSSSGLPITDDFLRAMNLRWFS